MHGIADFFKFHQWANARLLDVCEKLDDEALDAQAAGTYGTIRGALTHLFATQNEHLVAVDGSPPTVLFNGMPFPGFPSLRDTARVTDAAFLAAAERRDPEEQLAGEWQGQDYKFSIVVPLIQTVNHGIEHRTEIQSILSQRGIIPPTLNAWVWSGAVPG